MSLAILMKGGPMNRLSRITICFLSVLICAGLLNGPCFAFDDGDFQYWSSVTLPFEINEDWKGSFNEEFRLGDDVGELYYHHSDLGFVYKGLGDWIDL
jgi:hypothetical protein